MKEKLGKLKNSEQLDKIIATITFTVTSLILTIVNKLCNVYSTFKSIKSYNWFQIEESLPLILCVTVILSFIYGYMLTKYNDNKHKVTVASKLKSKSEEKENLKEFWFELVELVTGLSLSMNLSLLLRLINIVNIRYIILLIIIIISFLILLKFRGNTNNTRNLTVSSIADIILFILIGCMI